MQGWMQSHCGAGLPDAHRQVCIVVAGSINTAPGICPCMMYYTVLWLYTVYYSMYYYTARSKYYMYGMGTTCHDIHLRVYIILYINKRSRTGCHCVCAGWIGVCARGWIVRKHKHEDQMIVSRSSVYTRNTYFLAFEAPVRSCILFYYTRSQGSLYYLPYIIDIIRVLYQYYVFINPA